MDAVVQALTSADATIRTDELTEREYCNHADSFARGNHGAGGRDMNQRGLSAPGNQNQNPTLIVGGKPGGAALVVVVAAAFSVLSAEWPLTS
jgi:hypothetical protein